MLFERNHYLFEEFDRKFEQMFNAGLINYYAENFFKSMNQKRYKHLYRDSDPQVLSLKHLEAGLVIWLVSISFAIIAFTIEWISRLLDYLMINYILSVFFNVISLNTVNITKTREAAKVLINKTTHELDCLLLVSIETSSSGSTQQNSSNAKSNVMS